MEENNVNNQEQELGLKSTYESKKRKVGGTTKSGKNPFEITKYDRTEVASQIKGKKL